MLSEQERRFYNVVIMPIMMFKSEGTKAKVGSGGDEYVARIM